MVLVLVLTQNGVSVGVSGSVSVVVDDVKVVPGTRYFNTSTKAVVHMRSVALRMSRFETFRSRDSGMCRGSGGGGWHKYNSTG